MRLWEEMGKRHDLHNLTGRLLKIVRVTHLRLSDMCFVFPLYVLPLSENDTPRRVRYEADYSPFLLCFFSLV
jgi:hypothetical protein